MARVQLIDPTNQQVYSVDEEESDLAQRQNGLIPATPEQVREFELQQEHGGAIDQIKTGVEEAGRVVASGLAAGARLASSMGGEVDAMGNPTALTEPVLDVKGAHLVPPLYDEEALNRREANPGAAALGAAAPAAAASLLAPGAGLPGLVATVGLDTALAAAQEAADAEVESRDIKGETILRNAVLNNLFSGAGIAAPAAARALVRGGENVAIRSARSAVNRMEKWGNEALSKKADQVVQDSLRNLDSLKAPKVANNPESQKMAVQSLLDSVPRDTQLADELTTILNSTGQKKFLGLHELRAKLPANDDFLGSSIDQILTREDLWGRKILEFKDNLLTAQKMAPPAGSTADVLQSYADSIRKLGLNRQADRLEEVASTRALDALLGSPGVQRGLDLASQKVAGKVASVGLGAAGLTHGPLGGMLGYMVGESLEKPIGSVVRPALERGVVKVAEELKKLADMDRKITARLMVHPLEGQRYSRVYGDVPSVFERFQGDNKTLMQAHQASVESVQKFSENPQLLLDLVEEELGEVESPRLFNDMAAQAMRINSYLMNSMPPRRGMSVTRPQGLPPTRMEMRQWALKFSAATDPASVLSDARVGRLRREQVNTLKEVWPEEYTQLRNEVLAQIGPGVSTLTRQRLNLLFDFDGGIEPVLSSRVRQMVEAARMRNPDQGQPKANSNYAPKKPPSQMGNLPAGQAALQVGDQLV